MAALDQLLAAKTPFLTDGGIESQLGLHDHLNLPQDSAFVLLFEPRGRAALKRYFDSYLNIPESEKRGFVLDTATWRANMGWAESLGLNKSDIRHANAMAVKLAREIRGERSWQDRILINGCIGPLAPVSGPETLDPDQAAALHSAQLEVMADERVDLVTARALTDVNEAIGLTRRARSLGLPIALTFAPDLECRLPGGIPLSEAIAHIDAETGNGPLYFGISGVHPTLFLEQLRGPWLARLGVMRPNATPAPLGPQHLPDDADEDDEDSDPMEFAVLFAELARRLPNLRVIGGGAGTDARHIAAAASLA